ncbi:amino acid deaminase/aldolase [Agrococcus sp. HG114]|uniref:amino acid deaminase/aldolase n=1 Tax=Agrococcus sp. HG114 TaxID=2969757 RepID=UPI00215AF67B|nr:amino acid deaminase/aldolase [Agrococcus sp. HG114]MCR8669833.1 amino acid deaminase/aldolase [Agrococcus sp. HG114]
MTLRLADAQPWRADGHWQRMEAATAHLDGPFAACSLDALARNAADMVARAGGVPLRLATKSVRTRAVIEAVLATPGWHGVLAATLPEALWLSASIDDVLVGYPTTDRAALRALVRDDAARERITLMVDSVDHLELIDRVAPGHPELRIAIELDASWRLGPLYAGVRRSPQRTPAQLEALARAVVERPGFRLVGVMSYEAQVSGVQNAVPRGLVPPAALRLMQRLSVRELRERRGAAIAAVRQVADLELVNGGGTGSIETTAQDPAVTEIAAGSGLFGAHLFDGYRAFSVAPALAFALPVVRRPGPGWVTLLGGGWVASGPAGHDKEPVAVWPEGLRLDREEGVGEVHTPVRGAAADRLELGDRVWMRHAKAGELCERTDELHIVSGDQVVATVPTYRGEGRKLL